MREYICVTRSNITFDLKALVNLINVNVGIFPTFKFYKSLISQGSMLGEYKLMC